MLLTNVVGAVADLSMVESSRTFSLGLARNVLGPPSFFTEHS